MHLSSTVVFTAFVLLASASPIDRYSNSIRRRILSNSSSAAASSSGGQEMGNRQPPASAAASNSGGQEMGNRQPPAQAVAVSSGAPADPNTRGRRNGPSRPSSPQAVAQSRQSSLSPTEFRTARGMVIQNYLRNGQTVESRVTLRDEPEPITFHYTSEKPWNRAPQQYSPNTRGRSNGPSTSSSPPFTFEQYIAFDRSNEWQFRNYRSGPNKELRLTLVVDPNGVLSEFYPRPLTAQESERTDYTTTEHFESGTYIRNFWALGEHVLVFRRSTAGRWEVHVPPLHGEMEWVGRMSRLHV